MAAAGTGRCGDYCQHPCCWSAGRKDQTIYQRSPEYASYISRITNRRKLQKRTKSSYTVDGLPTLKIQTLHGDNEVCELKEPRIVPLPSHRRGQRHNIQSKPHSVQPPEVKYVQVSLEEDDDSIEESGDWCTDLKFTPVLIWKPGQKQHQALPLTRRQQASKSSISNIPRPVTKEETPSRSGSGKNAKTTSHTEQERTFTLTESTKTQLFVRKTNLTDMLPPLSNHPRQKASMVPLLKMPASSVAMSLSYLDDINLPPQLLEKILHHLRSESLPNIDDPTLTHRVPPDGQLSSKSTPLESKTTSTPMRQSVHSPVLSRPPFGSKRIRNLSTSKLAKVTQYSDAEKASSYSRRLTKSPKSVLTKHSRVPRRSGLQFPKYRFKEERQTINRAYYSTDVPVTQLSPGEIIPMYFPTPSQNNKQYQFSPANKPYVYAPKHVADQLTQKDQRPRLLCQDYLSPKPSNGVDTLTAPIQIPHVDRFGSNGCCPHRVTLELGSVYVSPQIRDTKPSPSPWLVSQQSKQFNDISQSRYVDVKYTSHQYTSTVTSRIHQEHQMVSMSPDFMLMGAEFLGDQLILSDKEGVVMKQFTETESESNFDPCSVEEKNISAGLEDKLASPTSKECLIKNQCPISESNHVPTPFTVQSVSNIQSPALEEIKDLFAELLQKPKNTPAASYVDEEGTVKHHVSKCESEIKSQIMDNTTVQHSKSKEDHSRMSSPCSFGDNSSSEFFNMHVESSESEVCPRDRNPRALICTSAAVEHVRPLGKVDADNDDCPPISEDVGILEDDKAPPPTVIEEARDQLERNSSISIDLQDMKHEKDCAITNSPPPSTVNVSENNNSAETPVMDGVEPSIIQEVHDQLERDSSISVDFQDINCATPPPSTVNATENNNSAETPLMDGMEET